MANHTTFVIAKEHIDFVMEEWKDEEEQKRKSDLKKKKTVLMTWKKMMVGLKIIKRVQEVYGRDGNRHLKEEINPLLMGLKIMKKVREAYNGNDNEYLKEKMNPFTNKK